ncbi:GDSL-type esterase/lipase family protein, partial [Desulfoplanes sp.]
MYYNGYRKPLYEFFRAEGYDIDYVGLQQAGRFEDPDNESFGGRTADELGANIYGWLESNPADIVLLHIGTNDITAHQAPYEIVTEVETVLDEIDRYDGETIVLVAQIINLVEEDGAEIYRNSTSEFNSLLADMVRERLGAGDKLVLVNQEEPLDYSLGSTDFFDMRHPSEIGYQKMADTWYWPLKDVLDRSDLPPLEAGEFAADHSWRRITFERRYLDPVVVVSPMGSGDDDPGVVRVRNVNATGCDIRIQGWDYLSDDHGPEQIGYVIVERGCYTLNDGTMVCADYMDTDLTQEFGEVLFTNAFVQAPVVLASISTQNENDAVSLRIDTVQNWGFTCRMQEQESNIQSHGVERVSYIAWEPSQGSLHDISFEVRRIETAVSNVPDRLAFSTPFGSSPVFIGTFQSFYGSDPCTLRWLDRDPSGISLYAQEECSLDQETEHRGESLGYLALVSKKSDIDADLDLIPDSEEIGIYGTDPSRQDTDDDGIGDGEELAYWGSLWNGDFDRDGLIQILDPDSDNDGDTDGYEINNGFDPLDPASVSQGKILPKIDSGVIVVEGVWQRVGFTYTYNDPVVVAGPLGVNEDEPATIRIRNVDANGFEIKIQEWGYQDNVHIGETVGYLVMERGKYTLDGGVRVCADRFTTPSSGARLQVDYPQVFSTDPVVLASMTSVNESEAVVGRLSEISVYGFEYGLQEEEQSDQTHAQETVSYIAWETSAGILGNLAFEVGRTNDVVTDAPHSVDFASSFNGHPGWVAGMQTMIGTDPCNVRCVDISPTGGDVFIDEEQSDNDETGHYGESVGYIVFSADPSDVDGDGDGIPNNEEADYGTDPTYPDSDNDGLLDGEEVGYWGTSWNQDPDGDGMVNLLDPDADGDGDLDGYEIENGYDPADPRSCSPNQTELTVTMGEIRLGTQWERVEFGHTFVHPIVVAGPIGFAQSGPAMVRIRNLNATGCEMALREWGYQDGVHGVEDVGYFVMEQGRYILGDGTRVCGGVIDTNGGGVLNFQFNQQFNQIPLVFSSMITENDASPAVGRLGSITKTGFEYLLMEEEAGDQVHGSEMVAYIAWEEFSGTVDGTTFSVVKHPKDVTHNFQTISFGQSFTVPPVFLADMQTFNGDNTANLRFRNKTSSGVDIKIEEEQSFDTETAHVGEQVGYMVFPHYLIDDDVDSDGLGNDDEETIYGTNATVADTDGDGIIDGEELAYWGDVWNTDTDNDGLYNLVDPDSDDDGSPDGYEKLHGYDPLDPDSFPPDEGAIAFEYGETTADTAWKRIAFQETFRDPVVVAGPMGYYDTQPATVCIRNVDTTGCEIRIKEWNCQDGIHAPESLTYMVMEHGEYVLEDGTRVNAGYREIQGGGSVLVTFSEPCTVEPVVVTAVMTQRESDPVVGRISAITPHGFTYLLQEEEQGDQIHGLETVGYIAWEPFSGILGNLAVDVGQTSTSMDHILRGIDFNRSFVGVPGVLADMQTCHGDNTCNLRYGETNAQTIGVMVKEEQSFDDEMDHVAAEMVGFIACSGHPDDVDLDRDGIDNDRESELFGTMPDDDDSDGDGLKDGQEVQYWGDGWDDDIDGDGISNLLDPDADNDGDYDGYEILMNTDPADPLSVSPSSTDVVFGVGEILVGDAWQHIVFTTGFTNPVFVAGPMGSNDVLPATVRVRNLNATGCDIRIQPWDYQSTGHASEQLGYLVMEEGKYSLADGTRLCAENIDIQQGSGQSVAFNQVFKGVPRIFASVVTCNDPSAVIGRTDKITQNGFSYLLQEQESGDQLHAPETISYIAWEDYSGTVNGYRFNIGLAASPITHEMQDVPLDDGFTMPPVLLADMQGIAGGNPANVRHGHKTVTTVGLAVVEEESADAELDHYGEQVAYIVCTHASALQDLDDDGLSNLQETTTYGTDPDDPDSDNDGMADGDEVAYWGDAWNQDLDGDGLINL